MKFKSFFLATIILISLISFNLLYSGDNILWQKDYSWGQVSSMEFSNDSKYLAIYLSDLARVDILRVQDSTLIKTIPFNRLPKFTTDGKYLATVNGKVLTLTSVETWETFKVFDLGYETDRYEFAKDMSFMACSGGNNGAVLLFDTQDYKLIKRIDDVPIIHDPKFGDKKGAQYISVSFDTRKIAYSNEDSTFVYDLVQNLLILRLGGKIPKFSPVRNELLVIYLDGTNYYKFDFGNQPEYLNFGGINSNYRISSNGNYIVYFGNNLSNVYVVDVKNNTLIGTYTGHTHASLDNTQRYLATTSSYIYLIDLGTLLGVTQQEPIRNFEVFPNPSNDNISINYSVLIPSFVELKLSNLAGNVNRLIQYEYQSEQQYTKIYSIADLPIGTYFITLKINEKIISKKINKVR